MFARRLKPLFPLLLRRFYSTSPFVPPEKKLLHDENVVIGSPTNTRNFGKIKTETDTSKILNELPRPEKFDNEDQTGMDYTDRLKSKLDKVNSIPDKGERYNALLVAQNQIVNEMRTEVIRELQFDPIEHKRAQENKKTYISTTEYTVSFNDTSNKDTTPKEEIPEGFSFNSINYDAVIVSETKQDNQRKYVKGHHGKELLLPKEEDIVVVERH